MSAPGRQGFGSTIISRAVPHDLGGEADVRFRLEGLEADFLIPQRHLANGQETSSAPLAAPPATPAATPAPAPGSLPARVLLVEDSVIIALDTEENLKRLGVAEVQVASSVEGALAAIAESPPDFALIDFNLGGESSEPIAEALRLAGVRFALATGYAEGVNAFERFGAQAVLRKPYALGDIKRLFGG